MGTPWTLDPGTSSAPLRPPAASVLAPPPPSAIIHRSPGAETGRMRTMGASASAMIVHVGALSAGHGYSWNTRRVTSSSLRASVKLLAKSTAEEITSIGVDCDDDSRRHILHVPPRLPTDAEEDRGDYPSPLHKIHVLPLLTEEEARELLRRARAYASETRSWDRQDSSRHVSYPTCDFAVEESIEVSEYLGRQGIGFEERIFGALGEAFDVDAEDMSFLDLFCASYEAAETDDTSDYEKGRQTMDRLDFHRDGSLLSFTMLLSPPEDFEGGGTVFDALGDVSAGHDKSSSILKPQGIVQPPEAGYATLHSGKLLHGGHTVTKGQRVVLVGFVDVHQRNVKTGVLGEATKEWGRNDVRMFWNRRRLTMWDQQQRKSVEGARGQPSWRLKNWRYLPKDTHERRLGSKEGRSYFGRNSVIPTSVLKTIEDRANPERLRQRRLATEDQLLREILLPREQRGQRSAIEEGEWMEVDLDGMDGLELGWENRNLNEIE
ncbi:hypothetical protein ACHAWF_003934 [Thalassiosira exigua]